MRLVTFKHKHGAPEHRVGVLLEEGSVVLDVSSAAKKTTGASEPALTSMQAVIEAGEHALDLIRWLAEAPVTEATYTYNDVKLIAPLPRPPRIRDCSLFLEHMENAFRQLARREAENEPDPVAAYDALMASGRFSLAPVWYERVLYYNGDPNAVLGPDEDVVWPSYSSWMDFELEWAAVIGRPTKDVTVDDARAHIFGYTIFNDWSARDEQLIVMEARMGPGEGKDWDCSYGLGPCIVTADAIPDPYDLTMLARVNGEEWSRGSTSTMHHRFETAIAQFSRSKTLHPGEIIGSGTVLGGCGFELGRRLAYGDVVELEVERIGILRNRVRQAEPVA